MSNTIEIDEIMKLLPHRYPMLLVDKIIELDDNKIVGIKCVSVNEPFFSGHFPGFPIMPGVLQIEAMAQTGGIFLLKRYGKDSPVTPYLMAVDKARFRNPVRPGDMMRIEVTILNLRSNAVKLQGRVLVGDIVASEAEITCMVVERK